MTSLPSFFESPIMGLYRIQLDKGTDTRGWFEEVWQREKWLGGPLANFSPVQQNASFNLQAGSTRGLHAEPWNKLVTVVSGRAFCAWVDLREGANFGNKYCAELSPGEAYLVPKGVANGYQAMEDNTVYTYLVDGHWAANAKYVALNILDSHLAIPWPISESDMQVSEKDLVNPSLSDVQFFPPTKTLIIGAKGQVGTALSEFIPDAVASKRESTYEDSAGTYDYVINAAAFTQVDDAEKDENLEALLDSNHELVCRLSKVSKKHGSVLVHYSSDYVFDGRKQGEWSEEDIPRPISRYGFSKLLGDYAAAANPKHYIIRTSWVYGSGPNFVRTMYERARLRKSVSVVSDQIGRPTAAIDLARFTKHLLDTNKPYGVYNYTGSGEPVSWYELARYIFLQVGCPVELVNPVTTEEFRQLNPHLAARPANSVLNLEKARNAGFVAKHWTESLNLYLTRLNS